MPLAFFICQMSIGADAHSLGVYMGADSRCQCQLNSTVVQYEKRKMQSTA